MQGSALPREEGARRAERRAPAPLETSTDERFERFTRIAQRVFQVPIALIQLSDADRRWCSPRRGHGVEALPSGIAFCEYALAPGEPLVVEDAREDARFRSDPLVTADPGYRFCAAWPLVSRGGSRIGTLCLLDARPRGFSDEDRTLLRDLGQLLEEELATLQLATQDTLTGLSNRRGFEAVVQKLLAVCDRSGTPVSLLYFDLDGFKLINDFHGHKEGDRALCEFSGLLNRVFRASDVVARLGGDEFCVVLTGTGAKDLQSAVDRFAQAVAEHNAQPGRRYRLAYSAGVFTRDAARHRSLSALLEEADRRMYEQKRTRKRQSGYSSE